MSERLTEIHLPHAPQSVGYCEHGERDVAFMIASLRRYAAHLRAQADAVEQAADHEFEVVTYLGTHVQRNRREIQRSSRLALGVPK